jgi:ferredoxin-NADP reductase
MMKQHNIRIKSIQHITPDVIQIVTEKPVNYTFIPGQATELSINKIGWQNDKRPFTFTSLPDNDYLQFTIKTYPTHKGITNEMLKLEVGDELILDEVFGAISYKGEGVFIAGGAGITPFISIFRHLHLINKIGNNKLIFANKTKDDIILADEFESLLGANFINILSEDSPLLWQNTLQYESSTKEIPGHDGQGKAEDLHLELSTNDRKSEFAFGLITESFLKKHISPLVENFYVCGPPIMMDAIEKQLLNLHINAHAIVKEAI